MPLLVCDEEVVEAMIAERQRCGGDRYDEVWDGVYVMPPIANNEHQSLGSDLGAILKSVVDWHDLGLTLVGAKVSDRDEDWTKNYRVPDVLVFKKGTSALDRGSHWLGGPELAIEIVSPGDCTLKKLDFYESVGTQELLVLDRHPWRLSLYRRSSNCQMELVAVSDDDHPGAIESNQFPVRFQLKSSDSCIELQNEHGHLIRAIKIQVKKSETSL